MAKVARTILVLRAIQLVLAIVFIVFWAWSCAVHTRIGGGAGEYFFGFFTALISLALSAHSIWLFARKQHDAKDSKLSYNTRWAIDLVIVILWIGVILVQLLVPIPSASNEPKSPGDVDDDLIPELGANVAELFSAITFYMTHLLFVFEAVRSRRARQREGDAQTSNA